MGAVFGTMAELKLFAQIFLGLQALALVWYLFRHKTVGLALPGEAGFDWNVLFLGLWCFAGLTIDGWAHKHGEVDDSFFTPWHAVWYSGFNAYATYIVFALWRVHEGPIPLSPAAMKAFLSGMPAGWSASVAGMVVFGLSGVGDMLWHAFLGIEGGTDILLSTTHIGLAAGLSLSLMAPFWAAWHTSGSGEEGLGSQVKMLFGLGAAWSVVTLFTSYAHHQTLPFTMLTFNDGLELGVTAILLQSAILSCVVLLFMRRWTPAPGAFTVLMLVNGIGIAAFAPGKLGQAWQHLVVPLLAGLALDLTFRLVDPFGSGRVRLFAFLVPALHTTVWLLANLRVTGWQVQLVNGDLLMAPLGWSVHATSGVVFLAGAVGVLVSLVAAPPEPPDAFTEP